MVDFFSKNSHLFFCLLLLFVQGSEIASGLENETETGDVSEQILAAVNSTEIRDYLKRLTLHPHMAGTALDNQLADWIAELWRDQGLDSVEKVSYSCLLSYPDPESPNKVELLDESGNVTFAASNAEIPMRPEDAHPDFVPAFNAFSPNGTVEGALVYAHYGRPEDFDALKNLGVNVSGKIVIAKYGEIYRGNKVKLAEQNGAVGVILFSDPLEYAQGDLYPDGMWLSGGGMQRGSIKVTKGDALTPQYPAIDGARRISLDEAELPRIPCQPIGYDAAAHFLNLTNGQPVPESWTAAHLLGAGQEAVNETRRVRLTVNNYLKMANVTNVIGIIRGSKEPDRYVLAGNHHDAWGFGAVDASSGTAQMLEVTRVFGQLLERGWRPKRTLVFCSWGGEEMGLIGSTEWVEDNYVKLTQRAVAYINTDVCVSGSKFSPAANPFLQHILIDVTKRIPAPLNRSRTLYDDWKEQFANKTENGRQIEVDIPGGGTDHVPFAYFAGIPSVDLTFGLDPSEFGVPIVSYPAYHSGIDTFHLVDSFIDPGFRHHRACSQLNGLLLQQIADADLIPFNLTRYSNYLLDAMDKFKKSPAYQQLLARGVNVDRLDFLIGRFNTTAHQWQLDLQNQTLEDPLILRSLNDQLSRLERAFLLPNGLPFQKSYRHMLFALSAHNFYGSNVFPGLQDFLSAVHSSGQEDGFWESVQRHVSDLIVGVHRAIESLQPSHLI